MSTSTSAIAARPGNPAAPPIPCAFLPASPLLAPTSPFLSTRSSSSSSHSSTSPPQQQVVRPGRRAAVRRRALSLPTAAAEALPVFSPSSFPPASSLIAAGSSPVVYEPQLDGGALVSLVVVAAVVIVFWLRVFVAIDDRVKRENVERLQKDVLVKRITGKLSDDDAEALRKAEEERAKPALGAVGAWLRGVRIVTEGRNNNSSNNRDGSGEE